VDDIEALRTHLSIDTWQVFGGSWGSTLALAYAQAHPARVTELVLRGIFMLRPSEIHWYYQGGGAEFIFPDAWEDYVKPIATTERGNMVAAYHKLLTGADAAKREGAAAAWTRWEMATSSLKVKQEDVARCAHALSFVVALSAAAMTRTRTCLAPARCAALRCVHALRCACACAACMPCHVLQMRCSKLADSSTLCDAARTTASLRSPLRALRTTTSSTRAFSPPKRAPLRYPPCAHTTHMHTHLHARSSSHCCPPPLTPARPRTPRRQLLDNIGAVRHIPTVIVQGRYDVVCPMRSAWDLHRAFPEAQLRVIGDAGHSAGEPGIAAALCDATDAFRGSAAAKANVAAAAPKAKADNA
jgi:pimeloyl-ACP methyl ester carboxylesterase